MKKIKVIKRDGVVAPFNPELVKSAIFKAAQEVDGLELEEIQALSERIGAEVGDHFYKCGGVVCVSEVQALLERKLMGTKYKDVARSLVEYRSERDRVREARSDLKKQIDDFLTGQDDEHSLENSNKNATQISTHRDLIAGIVSKQYADTILPRHVREAQKKGLIHMHDQDYLISSGMHNCGVYDFEKMLATGVKLGDVAIESPKSVLTAANVMCQILVNISGLSYGGQSIHEFDQVLRPYVIKSQEKLKAKYKERGYDEKYLWKDLEKEVYDACQLVIYQVQTVSSPNGQASFFSMSLSLATDKLSKMIKEQYLRCHMKGIGAKGTTPIFPKVLYFVEEGVNLDKGDPNYDEFRLALECSSKRMYPDFIMAENNRKMTGGSQLVSPMGKL